MFKKLMLKTSTKGRKIISYKNESKSKLLSGNSFAYNSDAASPV